MSRAAEKKKKQNSLDMSFDIFTKIPSFLTLDNQLIHLQVELWPLRFQEGRSLFHILLRIRKAAIDASILI